MSFISAGDAFQAFELTFLYRISAVEVSSSHDRLLAFLASNLFLYNMAVKPKVNIQWTSAESRRLGTWSKHSYMYYHSWNMPTKGIYRSAHMYWSSVRKSVSRSVFIPNNKDRKRVGYVVFATSCRVFEVFVLKVWKLKQDFLGKMLTKIYFPKNKKLEFPQI